MNVGIVVSLRQTNGCNFHYWPHLLNVMCAHLPMTSVDDTPFFCSGGRIRCRDCSPLGGSPKLVREPLGVQYYWSILGAALPQTL